MTDAQGSVARAERRRKKQQRRQAARDPAAGPGTTTSKGQLQKLSERTRPRGASQQMREPLIAFVHIPKTAGGTVKSVFSDAFGRGAVHDSGNYLRHPETNAAQAFQFAPRTRITIGHVPFGILQPHLPPGTRYITFLREPVERVVSHYFRHLDGKPGTRTLPEAFERRTPALTNLMTRFLCGRGHPEVLDSLPGVAVEEAKANLETFFFVGFQDRFDESLVLLHERLGMPITAYGDSRHVNAGRPSVEEVGDENRALIEEHNRLDIELYAWARDRLGGDFETRHDQLSAAVETLRCAVTAKAAAQEERTARAVHWLGEQLPPGTQRPFRELLANAEQMGLTARDVQQAARRMRPLARKVKSDRGVMLAVASESEAADLAQRTAKRQQRKETMATPEAHAATGAAARWLEEQLPPGTSRRKRDVFDAAKHAGVPEDAVRRAAQDLDLRQGLDEDGRKVWTAENVAAADEESAAHE